MKRCTLLQLDEVYEEVSLQSSRSSGVFGAKQTHQLVCNECHIAHAYREEMLLRLATYGFCESY